MWPRSVLRDVIKLSGADWRQIEGQKYECHCDIVGFVVVVVVVGVVGVVGVVVVLNKLKGIATW